MADITMCAGTKCKRRELCYRFTAKADEYRQVYFEQVPVKADGSCAYFFDKYLHQNVRDRV